MVDFLIELVKLETPSRSKEAQIPLFEMLQFRFKDLGYYCIHVDGNTSGGYLYARPTEKKSKAANQLLIGHSDTVWEKESLRDMPVTRLNGKTTGPGIYDMKAGLTQMYFALKAIDELGLSMPALPLVLINSDEEIGSAESTSVIRMLAKCSKRAFVLEPPLGLEGRLKTSRKGIGQFVISVKGVAAHAGLDPGKGVNAIVELSHQVQKLNAMNDFEKGVTVNVGMIEGGYSANVVAPESRAVVDVRVASIEDGHDISKKIRELEPVLEGIEIEVEGGIGRMPMEPTERNQKLWHKARANGEFLGISLEQAMAGGGSDGNTTSLFTATLDGLGTVGDGAHARHEFIFTDTIVERTALLAMLLLDTLD
ncbi:MAG: M20 family metallopeptidase [Flavobacteriaceae bacterium]|nr:M20 family metallopeptidase [Flavobacteriaceae bacterium]